MKKMTDEEIQQWLDDDRKKSLAAADELTGKDLQIYRLLFGELDKPSPEGLTYGFANRVDRRLQTAAKRKSDFRYFLISLATLAAVLVAIYGLLIVLKPLTGNQLFVKIIDYKWAFVFFVYGVVIIQHLDSVFIKIKFFGGVK